MEQQEIQDRKTFLTDKIIGENAFWSYTPESVKDIGLSDEFLIEKTLIYLDIPEINVLFSIFPKEKIRQVWEAKLLPQGEYLFNLNKFLAWFYFDIENDSQYVREHAN